MDEYTCVRNDWWDGYSSPLQEKLSLGKKNIENPHYFFHLNQEQNRPFDDFLPTNEGVLFSAGTRAFETNLEIIFARLGKDVREGCQHADDFVSVAATLFRTLALFINFHGSVSAMNLFHRGNLHHLNKGILNVMLQIETIRFPARERGLVEEPPHSMPRRE